MREQEAIKELEEMYKDGCYEEESLDAVDKEEALGMAIKALEEQDKNRWIPVSERLPEKTWHYMITRKGDFIAIPAFWIRGEQKWYHYMQNCYIQDEIIAWMPIPGPYRG